MWIEETRKVPITGCALQQGKKTGALSFPERTQVMSTSCRRILVCMPTCTCRTQGRDMGVPYKDARAEDCRLGVIEICGYCIDGFGKMMQKVYNVDFLARCH